MPDTDIYRSELLRCQVCGHENPRLHKFCGACGASLPDDQPRDDRARVEEEEPARAESVSQEERTTEPERESGSVLRPAESHADNAYDLSLFRSFREAEDSDEFEGSLFRPFRVYIGVALAVVLLAIAYVAVRNAQFGTRTRSEAPPPAAATEAPEKAATPNPAPGPGPASSGAGEHQNTPAAVPAAPAKSAAAPADQASAKISKEKIARNVPAEKTPDTSAGQTSSGHPSSGPGIDNGAEELAVARRYLGSGGQPRDPGEAAKWLWKSIAKHNAAAELLLADLYLKGEGVSKNCDQARVLLDTAARKGQPGAGERIRNLPAFGCQ